MKILYDDLGFREPVGGVSRYFTELIKHLPIETQWKIAAPGTYNAYLKEPPFSIRASSRSFRDFLPGVNFRGKSVIYGAFAKVGLLESMEWRNDGMFKALLERGVFDVLHLTGPHGCGKIWRRYRGKARIVMTVHDLIPDMFWSGVRGARVRRQRKYDLAHSDAVIAVSENTKKDLVRLYGTDESKITVIHHGFSPTGEAHKESRSVGGRYILYVGKRGGYKNSDFFMRELAPLLREDGSLRLVLTGRPLDGREDAMCRSLGIRDRVEARFFAEMDMPALYANAGCFVYPSKYEGFGFPVLEAFAAGCPAVLANASCFPEVGGGAALYFDPDSGEEMRSAVKAAMGGRREILVRLGRERVASFSWEKCVAKTMKVYEG